MRACPRCVLVVVSTLVLLAGEPLASAQVQPTPPPPPPPEYPVPVATEAPPPADENGEKKPKRGQFDAGGQVRLPSGPDENGEFATFNWVALDLVGRYFLLDSVSLNGMVPLAIIKPDTVGGAGGVGGVEPEIFGGISLRFEAMLPRMPFAPSAYKTDVGLVLTGAYMTEGAMLLSDKDYPLFVGDFQPGLAAGLIARVKLSTLVDFAFTPLFVYQHGDVESLTAIQVPTALVLRLGSFIKVSADVGVFTGDDYSLYGDNGGRVSLGASLTIKIGPILLHGGAGFASLLTGAFYPTVGDSLYIDLNAKYAK